MSAIQSIYKESKTSLQLHESKFLKVIFYKLYLYHKGHRKYNKPKKMKYLNAQMKSGKMCESDLHKAQMKSGKMCESES